jgi:predicted ATP-grasp superfamily ATP-dependent carboligase
MDVTVAEERLPCLASVSRYCARGLAAPSPVRAPGEFVDFLVHEVARNAYDLLIPMTDVTAILVAQNADRLESHVRIPMVPWARFDRALDKEYLIGLAANLNVPAPRTWIVESIDDLRSIEAELTFPLVVKPRRSKYLQGNRWVSEPVTYVADMGALRRRLDRAQPGIPLPMLQERVTGPGCGAFLLFDHGKANAVFFHRRLREKPPSGGVSVLRESIPVDPTMRAHAETLLSALEWQGVAMVEFKVDARDGRPMLMEINPRFWGSLQLAIDAGVDFPRLLCRQALGEALEPVLSYAEGVRSRWLLGDLDHLTACLLKSRQRLHLPDGYPGRLEVLRDFFLGSGRKTRLEVLRREDPRPFLLELKEYVKAPFRSRSSPDPGA